MMQPAVLIVDDNEFFLKMQKLLLERSGLTVLTAHDGLEGLDILLSAERIDAVVTDLMMPRLSGLELCRKIRERSPGLPVILVTGAEDKECAEQPQIFGFDAALTKPFDPRELISLISRLLSDAARNPNAEDFFPSLPKAGGAK